MQFYHLSLCVLKSISRKTNLNTIIIKKGQMVHEDFSVRI